MEQVPIPEAGPSDVLIKVKKSAICGTDVHIWKWDEWSARVAPVPHGRRPRVRAARSSSGARRGPSTSSVSGCPVRAHRLRPLPQLPGRARASVSRHIGVGVNRAGAFAEFLCTPGDQRRSDPRRHPRRDCGHLRSVRQCDTHGAELRSGGRGRAHHRRRADRYHGSAGCTGRRAQRRGHRREPLPAATGQTMGATRVNVREREARRRHARTGHDRGFDVGLEMSGSRRPSATCSAHVPRRQGRAARHPAADTRIDWDHVIFKGLTIKGIYGREMFETWYKMTPLRAGRAWTSPS